MESEDDMIFFMDTKFFFPDPKTNPAEDRTLARQVLRPETPVRQVLLPGRQVRREPGCQGRRHGTTRPPSRTDADDVARQVLLPERQDRPDTRTRQDLRDDKIGTDQGGSDVPPDANQVLLGCDKIDFRCPRPISSSRSPVEP